MNDVCASLIYHFKKEHRSTSYHNVATFHCEKMSQFKCPSSIMIPGPSQCGKTTFTKQLLEQADSLFERPMRKIVYCYGQWQECFRNMTAQVTFVEAIPEDIPSLFPANCRPGIVVLDDLMRNCSDDERILDLFAHYIIAFKNPLRYAGFSNIGSAGIRRKCTLRMGELSRCDVKPIWLSCLGLTSSYTKYSTVTDKDIANVTFLSRDLRRQEMSLNRGTSTGGFQLT